MNRLAWLIAPSGHQVLFALRLCTAIALALYVSMLLHLDRPYWASLEVAVMILPIPGQAVARAFARAVGTIVAGCAGLLIVALFAQSYELSALALAIWVALCAFGANLLRNYLSYGFAIAGLIASITVVLSHTLNQPAFHVAVERTSECLLAAVITAAVTVVFSPPTGIRNYFKDRLALLRNLGGEFTHLATTLDRVRKSQSEPTSAEDPHSALRELIAQTLALEHSRQYLRYEAPEFANFDRLARRLNYDILSLISAASSLHIYLANQKDAIDTRAVAALAEPAALLHEAPENWEAAKTAFDTAHMRILAIAREPAEKQDRPRRLADWVVISRALGLVSRCRALLVTHNLLVAERRNPPARISRRSEFSRPMDVKNAARNGLRTFIAVSVGGVVWMNFHDQLPAVILMILLSAFTAIVPTVAPEPVAALRLFGWGLAAAAISAFCVNFLILPMANSFAVLMLAMMPFVFIGGLAMAVPKPVLAAPGRVSVLMFSLLVHVQNSARLGLPTYIQIVMGITGAIVLTILGFSLVLPVSPRQRLREQMAGVLDELGDDVGGHHRERFETRMYDRLNALAINETDDPDRFSAHQAVQAAVNIGVEARSLVVVSRRVALPAQLRRTIRDEINSLGGLFKGRRVVSTEQIAARSSALHELAERLLENALSLERESERRLGIRAAICAELTASALTDYVQAFHPSGEAESAEQSQSEGQT